MNQNNLTEEQREKYHEYMRAWSRNYRATHPEQIEQSRLRQAARFLRRHGFETVAEVIGYEPTPANEGDEA